ncbi:hypothetical protein D3C86_1666050 [compost metagenome]
MEESQLVMGDTEKTGISGTCPRRAWTRARFNSSASPIKPTARFRSTPSLRRSWWRFRRNGSEDATLTREGPTLALCAGAYSRRVRVTRSSPPGVVKRAVVMGSQVAMTTSASIMRPSLSRTPRAAPLRIRISSTSAFSFRSPPEAA